MPITVSSVLDTMAVLLEPQDAWGVIAPEHLVVFRQGAPTLVVQDHA